MEIITWLPPLNQLPTSIYLHLSMSLKATEENFSLSKEAKHQKKNLCNLPIYLSQLMTTGQSFLFKLK